MEKIKSVFKQKTYEKLYKYEWLVRSGYVTEINYTNEKPISEEIIGEYEINEPLLKVGDKIFLHDIQKEVRIESIIRSTDNTVTYYIEYKTVETINSLKSYSEAQAIVNKE